MTIVEGQTHHEEILYGVGVKVRGKIEGMDYRAFQTVTLRRPGGPPPEEVNPLDMEAGIRAAEFNTGMGFMLPDNTYEIMDVPPGTYWLELLATPDNPADIVAMAAMDRTPFYRAKIVVGEEDIEHDMTVERR